MAKAAKKTADDTAIKFDTSKWPADKTEIIPLADLTPYENNANTHSDKQVDEIVASIVEWGWTVPVIVDEDNMIIAGHGRVLAATKLGIEAVPCVRATGWSDAKKRAYVLADNQLARNSEWDPTRLTEELLYLQGEDFNLDLIGFDADELAALMGEDAEDPHASATPGSLVEKFGAPPFSVLNAREGWWQERKRDWISIGIKSELGRGENLTSMPSATEDYKANKGSFAKKASPGGSQMPAADYSKSKARGDGAGKATAKAFNTEGNVSEATGTSIFDPVLCELAYRWFSPQGGVVLDPFAGGSVRGIVASKLGREYVGVDLRAEQIEANREQGKKLCPKNAPTWHCGDSMDISKIAKGVKADFLFSCPPYADLEVYSDNPKDLSTMAYDDFVTAYRAIIAASVGMLKEDRFACFVVGDIRDKDGMYRNFVGDTVEAFRDAGAAYYNEAILVTMVGSLPIRVGKQFSVTRKLGKTHQNVLVFCKGDPRKATAAIGETEFGTIDDDAVDPEILNG